MTAHPLRYEDDERPCEHEFCSYYGSECPAGCNGTGTLPANPNAEKVLEVWGGHYGMGGVGYWWHKLPHPHGQLSNGCYPTADKALAAGRLALCEACKGTNGFSANGEGWHPGDPDYCLNCQRAREVLGDG